MAIKKEIEIVAKTADANKNIEKTTKELKKTNEAASTVNSQIDAITGGALSKFQNFTKGIKGVSKGFGALRGAIIATGLGALVVLVGSLIEYFSNFEAGVKIVNQIMNTLSGTVNAIVANFQKLLSGDFLGFFKGVAQGAQEAWENTDKLFQAQEKLFELNKKFIVDNAKLNAEIEAQGRIVGDTTLSFEERLKAQQEINKTSEQLIQNEKELTEAELDRLKTELALENNYEKRRDLEIEIEQTMANLISVESRLASQRDAAAKAEREIAKEQQRQQDDRIAKAREAAQRIAQERANEKKALLDVENNFRKQIEDLEDKTEEQRLERSRERALQQIEELKGTETDKENARLQVLEFYAAKELELEAKKQADLDKIKEQKRIETELLEKQYNERALAEQTQYALALAEADEQIAIAKRNALNVGLESLRQFAGENKALSAAILGVQKALAVAEIITNAKKGIAASLVNWQSVPPFIGSFPNPAYVKAGILHGKHVAMTKITAGASIASILAQSITSIKGAGGLGGASGAGGGGGGGAAQPAFNVVGTSGVNQIAEQLSQEQEPVQAFVVGSNVTTQQEMDRNIVTTASLG